MKDKIPKLNPSGLKDPTAHDALSTVQQETDEVEARKKKLLHLMKTLADLSDFDILNRIELRDRQSGRFFY